MLAAKPKTRRFLEITQFVVTFVSVCAVVDASRIQSPPDARPGYQASVPLRSETSRDRRIGDLARVERKRREAEQQSSRRGFKLGYALGQRQVEA